MKKLKQFIKNFARLNMLLTAQTRQEILVSGKQNGKSLGRTIWPKILHKTETTKHDGCIDPHVRDDRVAQVR